MGCEDGRDVDAAFTAEGDSEPSLPFVEMGDDSLFELMGRIL